MSAISPGANLIVSERPKVKRRDCEARSKAINSGREINSGAPRLRQYS